MVTSSFRSQAPAQVKRVGRALSTRVGTATASLRMSPDFLLIGAQRSGTTSLFRALLAHPDVVRPVMHKGINYFDLNYWRGPEWYRGHFPVEATTTLRRGGRRPLAFEASGYYVYHPTAISRLAADLPDAKLVVMLRDPVERAYSAWKHESQRGFDDASFADALAREDQRIAGEAERLREDPRYFSFAHRHHSYRHRGDYVEQLQRVLQHFPRERLHVVYSESFFANPTSEFRRLARFLGVAEGAQIPFGHYNARSGTELPQDTRAVLTQHYLPQFAALTAIVGQAPPWEL